MPHFPLQYIDLFAGCGGLSTGLHLSGWKGLFAVERNPAAFATLKANRLQKHLRCHTGRHSPDSHRFVNHTGEVEAVFARLLADAPRNRCIMGQAREPYGLKKRSVTVLAGLQPAPTVTTIPDDFVHYSESRVMTVRECARLQTFPDWFEFKGPYTTGGKLRVQQTPRYTQVGNAVPPLFAKIAGLALKEVLSNGYAKKPFFHFVYHDGGLERLQNKLKLALLRIIRETCATHGIQYVFSALSEDIPTQEDTENLCPTPDEIILTLDDSGNMGRLSKMGPF